MTVRLPMTYGEFDVANLQQLVDDDKYLFEQKLDGTRCLVVISKELGKEAYVRFLGRNGQELTHAAAKQHFPILSRYLLPMMLGPASGEIVLDGEIMIDTGEYHVFDLPYLAYGDQEYVTPDMDLKRRKLGMGLLAFVGPVKAVTSYWTSGQKMHLLAHIDDIEGVMLKDVYGPYEPGRRVNHSLKAKFVKTADVVVTAVDRPDPKHGSFTLAVYDTYDTDNPVPQLRQVGACSAIGKPEVKVGDVIEVAYLYMTVAHTLYQPRMIRVREDREPESCGMTQFRLYKKMVV